MWKSDIYKDCKMKYVMRERIVFVFLFFWWGHGAGDGCVVGFMDKVRYYSGYFTLVFFKSSSLKFWDTRGQ